MGDAAACRHDSAGFERGPERSHSPALRIAKLARGLEHSSTDEATDEEPDGEDTDPQSRETPRKRFKHCPRGRAWRLAKPVHDERRDGLASGASSPLTHCTPTERALLMNDEWPGTIPAGNLRQT